MTETVVRIEFQENGSGARHCGECTLCCKLLPMKSDLYPRERIAAAVNEMIARGMAAPEHFAGMRPEWNKPAGKPCQHQRHGKGCAIYAQRPFGCRMWSCRWLNGNDTAELRRPDRSRVVVDVMPDFVTFKPNDGSPCFNIEVVQIWCDPKTPDAWRDPTVLAFIERRAREGIAALIRFDNRKAITVFAPPMAADGQWHELSRGNVEPEHRGADLIAGLGAARKVKVG